MRGSRRVDVRIRAGHDAADALRAAEGPLDGALLRPAQIELTPPCSAGCSAGSDVRGWLGIVAQRRQLGLSEEEAWARAWRAIALVNPFPATTGRICPHPCESGCNRAAKDGAVAIRALERFLGDWGLEMDLSLPTLEGGPWPESIAAIGAGPAGLSFAYQMARRGYRVTVYERQARPGGMLRYGIPAYRLPEDVLDREIARVLDLGVELKLGVQVGRQTSLRDLRERHRALFLGIGSGLGLRLGVPGEEGPGVWTGIEYLGALNRGDSIALGRQVVVVGGGDTALDAARSARRSGARVAVLYRRSPAEMPAHAGEVEAARAEGVEFEYLASPLRIERHDGAVKGVVAQRMCLGEPDASGRRRCVPVEGDQRTLPADSTIVAVSRVPDWEGLGDADPDAFAVGGLVLRGGDVQGSSVAAAAIAQGRVAAEALHARLRGIDETLPCADAGAAAPVVKPDLYAPRERTSLPSRSVEARLAEPGAEVEQTIDARQFASEIERCFSCGSCFGCDLCFTYCNAGAFTRLDAFRPGAYFSLALDRCEACRKCVELCPCGFLQAGSSASGRAQRRSR